MRLVDLSQYAKLTSVNTCTFPFFEYSANSFKHYITDLPVTAIDMTVATLTGRLQNKRVEAKKLDDTLVIEFDKNVATFQWSPHAVTQVLSFLVLYDTGVIDSDDDYYRLFTYIGDKHYAASAALTLLWTGKVQLGQQIAALAVKECALAS